MFVNDLRNGFYNQIFGKRVLLLVSFDVDALCACKILQYLMQCDHITYSIVAVTDVESMREAYNNHSEQVKHVVFINCGGTINLVQELVPDEDVIFFVIDSHRPINVYNIYNGNQVRLLMSLDEDEDIPALEDVYREDFAESDDDDEANENASDDEGNPESASTRRLDEAQIEHRIQRRQWEDKRNKILFEYNQFSYHGNSSAVIMFDLAWKMSKDNNVLLWWAILGLTDQYQHQKIERTKYILQAGGLQGHVSRLNHKDAGEHAASVSCLKLALNKDLQLALYRHWTLYESLKHTNYTACKFRLWTLKGSKRLYEFLAELGLPLAQCRQRFCSMDMYLRQNLKSWIDDKVEKYNLDDILKETFTVQFGFRHRFSSSDYVHAASALLESGDKSETRTENFLEALDCLSRSHLSLLERGIDLAKKQLVSIFLQIQTFLDLNQVICAGPFLYAVISESAPGSGLFAHPLCLSRLAHGLLQAHVSMSRNKKARTLPLVLTAPSSEAGKTLVIGIPPLSEDSPKNFFGQAFAQASEEAKTEINDNLFESFIIEIKSEDNSKFFDALISILS